MHDLDRRLTETAISRRRFLQGTTLVGVSAFIAACTGSTGTTSAPSTVASPSSAPSAAASEVPSSAPSAAPIAKTITGPLKFANWPAYIDLTGKAGDAGAYAPGSSPTLEEFKTKYKIEVDYEEKISDNPTFVATIQTALVGGLPTGWDLMVLTDWIASKLVAKDWIQKLDQADLPNCVKNLRQALRNQTWDPGNDYHYPWQSGMTGIGVNTKTLKDNGIAEPTKLADLWSVPADKLTFLSEARDTFGLTLLKLGKPADPTTVSDADLQACADDIQPLVDKGLRFTGNEYLTDFGQKKVWAAFVWSGDLASSGSADDKFIFPDEGTMIWTDNMLIPKGAANPYTAELMMNWVYDPKIAAQIADYVFYVSPVEGAAEEIKKIDASAASNPLLFPTAEIVAKQVNFQALSDAREKTLNDLFSKLSGT